MRRMMGIHDDNRNSFDVCTYDPAPPRDVLVRSWEKEGLGADVIATNKNCMSTEFFAWILKHIRVRREIPVYDPAKSLQGRGNSDHATAVDHYVSKLNDDSLIHAGGAHTQQLSFDRQLAQGVTYSMDKQFILLQILHGVSPGMAKRQEAHSGRPQAGKRFVSGDDMTALQDGLTVCIHHINSDTTICLVIQDRQLDIVAETFDVPLKNYPRIAEALFAKAGEIIRLHLTDGMCKDVTLSVLLKKEMENTKTTNNATARSLMMKMPLQDQYKHTSRRYGRVNKQRGRLGAAAFLLDMVEGEEEGEVAHGE